MQQLDYIVIGSGSAGAIVAARLSEDPDVRVLLLEAGGTDRKQILRRPGMISILHQIKELKAKYDWGYKTAPQRHMSGRRLNYTRGRVLGGCSSVNGMLYLRGNRQNYDDWAAAGCEGWDYDSVLPYYRRLEDHEDGASKYHGAGGPVAVTRHPEIGRVSQAFMEAVEDVYGLPILDDFNGERQEGASTYQMTARDGVRYSTAEAYIHPNEDRPNLQVELGAQVRRIIVEDGRAVGVRFLQDRKLRVARASREIILAAGAIGSPQILMLSGIGPAEHLEDKGIEVVTDLPGVGQNLHDHLFVPMTYRAPESGHRGTPAHFFGGMLREVVRGKTWFGRTVFESGAFLKSDDSQRIPNLQFHTLPWGYPEPNQDGDERAYVDEGYCYTVMPTLIYPKSRGSVRLETSNPDDAPIIDPNFLAEPEDLHTLVRGMRMARDLLRSPKIASYIHEELAPGVHSASDDELADEVRLRATTVYHPVGTCKMGVDEGAVVDPQLRVHGVEGLRVADASILPSITGGNTNGPSMLIGERCAGLIRGD